MGAKHSSPNVPSCVKVGTITFEAGAIKVLFFGRVRDGGYIDLAWAVLSKSGQVYYVLESINRDTKSFYTTVYNVKEVDIVTVCTGESEFRILTTKKAGYRGQRLENLVNGEKMIIYSKLKNNTLLYDECLDKMNDSIKFPVTDNELFNKFKFFFKDPEPAATEPKPQPKVSDTKDVKIE